MRGEKKTLKCVRERDGGGRQKSQKRGHFQWGKRGSAAEFE